MTTREEYLASHIDRATKVFRQHVITKTSDRRWLIQRMHKDGKPDWTFAAEIICLENPAIYVGGDIDTVVFAYGPKDPMERLYWIGNSGDTDGYVAEKARIGLRGTGSSVWDEDVAETNLKSYLEELVSESNFDKSDRDQFDQYAFDSACGSDDSDSFLAHVYDAFPRRNKHDLWERCYDMGEVVAPAIVYAHAAVRRLCQLLKESNADV